MEHEPGRVVVRFADHPPSALIARALRVESGCCPFFEIDYDPVSRRFAISADHPDHRAEVDAIAHALMETRATVPLPAGTQGAPDVRSVVERGSAVATPSRCGWRR